MKNRLIIIGAGGHGKVVAETAILQNKYDVAGFADDSISKGTIIINNLSVVGSINEVVENTGEFEHFIVALGNNQKRMELSGKLESTLKPATIIHPSSVISSSAVVGEGSILLPNSVVNAGAEIGRHCIINSQTLVDHDSHIGNFVHIAQGTIVGSNVRISDLITTSLGEKIYSGELYIQKHS